MVAVCSTTSARLTGLSEVADALALGRTLVVTDSPWLDLDLTGLGCGSSVPVGDVDALARALGSTGRRTRSGGTQPALVRAKPRSKAGTLKPSGMSFLQAVVDAGERL